MYRDEDYMDPEVKEMIEFVSKHKWKFITPIAALAISVIAYEQYSKKEFQDFLENNPVSGIIAYSVDNNISWINVSDPNQKQTIQTPKDVEDLLWLNDQEIVYVSNGENDRVSDHIFKANTLTGDISTLFDPYDSSYEKYFPDTEKADKIAEEKFQKYQSEMEERIEENREKGVSGIYVNNLPREGFRISELGVHDGQTFFKHGEIWYSVANGIIDRLTKLPDELVTSQINHSSGNYSLQKAGIGPFKQVRIKRNGSSHTVFYLDKEANHASWRS